MHQGVSRRAEDGQEIRLADKNLYSLRTSFHLATKVGKKLERRKVLLGSLPAFENNERFKCEAAVSGGQQLWRQAK